MTDKKVTDHVETLQLAIEQVQNPELREDAQNALTALLETWVQPEPARRTLSEFLAREHRRMQEDLSRRIYDGFVPAVPSHWWQATPDYKMDEKTRDFVKVYAQGRARNKPPGKAKTLRP